MKFHSPAPSFCARAATILILLMAVCPSCFPKGLRLSLELLRGAFESRNLCSPELPSREAPALDGNFHGKEADRYWLGYFLAICQAVFHMQRHGILDIRHGRFVRLPLVVAPLKRRTGNEVTIFVTFQYHRMRYALLGASTFFSQKEFDALQSNI